MDGKWYPPEQHPSALATATFATPPVLPDEKREGNASQSSGWRNASDGGAWDQSPPGAVPRAATMQGDLLTSVPVTSHSLTDFSSRALPTSATSQRRRTPLKRRSLLLAVMALIVLGGGGGGVLVYSLTHDSGTSITGDSPRQVIALATAAVQKAGSVHVVVSLQVPGQTATYVNDTSVRSGRQVITSSGGVQVTTLVVGGTAYVRANQVGLVTLFQSPTDIAQRFANQWLSFGSSSQAYNPIAESLTLSSLLREVTPTSPVSKLAPSVVDGRSVVGIRGELPGGLPGTLYVSATGAPLPVEEVSHASSGSTTAIFSEWGSPVHVTAPSGAISGGTIPTLFGVSGSESDRAAQSNLTNALTEAKALYQNSQSYSPGGRP